MANDDYLSQVETRIDAVLAEGRGVAGELGTEAQLRAIPVGIFRKQPDNADMSDLSMPPELFDRGYFLRFLILTDSPDSNNPYQSVQFRTISLRVTVGYVYGASSTQFVDAQGTETKAVAALRADRRAISDGNRIDRALRFAPLRGLDTDPVMVEVQRTTSDWVDLGGGRSLCHTNFSLVLQSDENRSYGP